MPKLTAEEFVEKHARRLKGAIEDIKRGVDKVTEAPSKLAVGKQAKMKAKLVAAIETGKWAARLSKVSLEEWRKKMLDKGVPRISGGIDASADKVMDFASQVLPYIEGLQAKVKKMPDITLEDSISRMTEFIRGMSKFELK